MGLSVPSDPHDEEISRTMLGQGGTRWQKEQIDYLFFVNTMEEYRVTESSETEL